MKKEKERQQEKKRQQERERQERKRHKEKKLIEEYNIDIRKYEAELDNLEIKKKAVAAKIRLKKDKIAAMNPKN